MAAIALFDKGLNNSEIGRRLKVCNQTVSRWRKQFEKGGRHNLQKAGRAGRKPLMSDTDRQRLVELLQQGPERFQLEKVAVPNCYGLAAQANNNPGAFAAAAAIASQYHVACQ